MIIRKQVDDRIIYTILVLKNDSYVENYIFIPETYSLRKTLGNISYKYNKENLDKYIQETKILVREAIKDLFI
jgi:hypothetical protein